MQNLGLSPEEFRHVVRACERVPVNTHTPSLDLKRFLATRLSDELPDAAARIEQFDDRQVDQLRQEIVAALDAHADSALWG
jgi:hypothetical protein